jgi:glycosyltransferase involved in cell wall biosynthesis
MTRQVTPKVSVCMPVYNGSDYIAEAIESVLEQTYKDFSLIVCDNCSTDNTEEIARNFRDSRITYVRNPRNLGPVANANRCLELAEGEYVCIFHHDDVMLQDNLERKVRLLDEHPKAGFVHSNIILIDPLGNVIAQQIWNEDSRKDYMEDGLAVFYRFVKSFHLSSNIFIGSVLARRSCYERVGGFNPDLPHCNDGEMWMRMLLFYNIACIGKPLVKYRVHATSASSSWGDYTSVNYIKEHYLAVAMIFDKYKDHIPDEERLKQQVFFSFAEHALKCASGHFSKELFASGRMLFHEALKMYPRIFRSMLFWKAAARLTVGPLGVRFYNSVRKRIADTSFE